MVSVLSCDSQTLTLHMRETTPLLAFSLQGLYLSSPCVLSYCFYPTFCSMCFETRMGTAHTDECKGKSHTQEWILLYEQLIKRDKLLFAFYACRKREHELIVLSVEEPEEIQRVYKFNAKYKPKCKYWFPSRFSRL